MKSEGANPYPSAANRRCLNTNCGHDLHLDKVRTISRDLCWACELEARERVRIALKAIGKGERQ